MACGMWSASACAVLLLALGLCAHAVAARSLQATDMMMENPDHSTHDHSSMNTSKPMAGGMLMRHGSANMSDPCYVTPSADSCAAFNRADEDWTDDLMLLCDAMPFMVACTLWEQCQNGTATGAFCEVSSLTGSACMDMPKMRGCEAYNALCGNSTMVEQCQLPGPIPDVLTTFKVKDGIKSLCDSHCMPGCDVCGTSGNWKTCTEPLMVLAYMCCEMPTMSECDTTGFSTMCMNTEMKDNFPLVCAEPPVVPNNCS